MDLKNIIAAIALSAAVIVLYGLFFAPSPEQLSKSNKILILSPIPKLNLGFYIVMLIH